MGLAKFYMLQCTKFSGGVMAEQIENVMNLDEMKEFVDSVQDVALQTQRVTEQFIAQQAANGFQVEDALGLNTTFTELWRCMMTDSSKLMQHQMDLWKDMTKLGEYTMYRMAGMDVQPVIQEAGGDRRFKADDWKDNIAFDALKQSYLLMGRCVLACVASVEGMDEKSHTKAQFFTQQMVDALSPTNFAMTNPTVLRETVEAKGENLLKGFKTFLDDLETGNGRLATKMTDTQAFELGQNIATTPGDVVYENDMVQLIQYRPSTKEVFKRPLLVVPPWINKYYILDLQPKNSLIKWLVDQGHTVFVISWVNPGESHAEKNFENYLQEGMIDVLDVIEQITGEPQVNTIGYCLGGTLLAATNGYLTAEGNKRIASSTYFTTMIDFTDPGEIGVFIDDEQLDNLEKKMDKDGYLEGSSMASAFNMLRANDLIWPFFIQSYLMGKEPMSFDLLYWNSDSTRMPAAMHRFYLRNMYQDNLLCKKKGLNLLENDIDLSEVKTPSYFLSTIDDHIAPWQSTFSGAKLMAGPVRFVLGGSGHIAGVVNPPAANKYGYKTGAKPSGRAETWLKNSKQHEGSWWNDWSNWVKKYVGSAKLVPARIPGEGPMKVIEAAPGRYASTRIMP